ncbi:hypothetical protein NQ314_020823 [Rhamnusium bicolor]|uniref:ABC transmembrane type-1 domain-containing protein n=1 Tax=Rhamnusium bicolor TaxID=1586634 RepID=A0AAV8WKD2_9CUCU|nr:hypothetical protein NQ314_020823 [Rhamnusium bicolor]
MFYGVILALSEAIRIGQPIVLGQLISFYLPGQDEITQEQAYLYAAGVVLCSLVNILFSHPYMMGVLHLGMKMRIACCSLIYRKSLKLSKTALGQTTAGQVVNLLSNDVNRFDVAVIFAHQLWIGPIETIICTYFMYLQVGPSAAVGVLLLIMFIPMQSMKLKKIRLTSFMRGIILSFIMYSTRLSIFGSILAYVLLGNDITAEKVFVLTCFYNILRQTMTVFFPTRNLTSG